MDQVVVAIETTVADRFLAIAPEKIEQATYRAINKTAARSRARMSQLIRGEVAFPARYLSDKKLQVVQKARAGQLEAIVRGSDRPTSLARFVKSVSKKGIRVKVDKTGGGKLVTRAFLIKLKNGNQGFAVRTDGEPPRNAYVPRKLSDRLYLLYGPSVDQVLFSLRNQGGVVTEVEAEAGEFLEKELVRLLDLELGK